MPTTKLLLLVPMAAAALVTPGGIHNAAAGVQRISRRSVFLGTAGALLSAPIPAARAETPVKVEVPVKTTDYKGFNLFGEGSAERCESGEGAACDRLAGGSELILELQQQSRTNKEKNAEQLYEQTVRNLNYGAYFDAFDKNLVQLPNGKFAAYDIETYTQMRKDGKIKIGSFDTLIDPETGEPPLLAGATANTAVPTKGPVSLEYQDLVERLKAGGVEGVVFQAPRGDTALALLGGDKLGRTEVKASWKKAELVKVMARLGVPNNFAELSVVVPGITSTR
jgi:hypothetical protein